MQSKRDFYKYLSYGFDEFIVSDQFRQWVLDPSQDDRLFWDEFLTQYPEKIETVKEAKEFLLGTRNYFEANDLSLEDVQRKLGQISDKTSEHHPKRKQRALLLFSYPRAIAAAVVAIVLVSSYFVFTSNGLVTYTTDFGEWKSVVLPDGTKVNLNANSELILASDWSEGTIRQVWLKGEAFFNVTKQEATHTKFQVITNDLTIEVLGTEFNVQDRGKQTEVYLHEGKIKLDLGVAEKDLNPGDFISYSAEKNMVITETNMEASDHVSWKEGVLKLKNATILEILREVEEIYGVEIMVSNKTMLSEKRTIGVPMKNLEIVIPMLETTLGAEVSRAGNKLLVK